MNGSLGFAVAWWWFPLLVVPGLWLTARLYLRGPVRHPVLAGLSACVWILLGLWVVSPTWRFQPEAWHPPLVVLAVDDGASYAALGARHIALAERRAARVHYESRGFRVEETGFRGPLPGGSAYPNLQAVLLWSDGRASGSNARDATGPVYPVRVFVENAEVQGEDAVVRLRDEGPDGSVVLMVAWRVTGMRAANARIRLHVKGNPVWTGILAHPSSVRAGERVMSEVVLPVAAAEAVREAGGGILAIVQPVEAGDNAFVENDTVHVDASGLHRMWQVFIRPLTTLQERGLLDALGGESRFRVAAMSPRDATEHLKGDGATLLWMPPSRTDMPLRADERVAVVRYRFPIGTGVDAFRDAARTRGERGFTPDARIERAAPVGGLLPTGALRLADLGFGEEKAGVAAWILGPDREGLEPLAWVVEDGRRGLLFWRDRESGTYGFVVPPLWGVRFQADGASGGAAFSPTSLMTAWVRGAAWWMLLHRSGTSGAAGAPGTGGEASVSVRAGVAEGAVSMSTDSFAHPAASMPPSSSSSPHPSSPLARLGTDVEALTILAARQGAHIVVPGTSRQATVNLGERGVAGNEGGRNMEVAQPWPLLPDGHMRETRVRAFPLAPPLPVVLVLTGLLVCVWFVRKRRQLD